MSQDQAGQGDPIMKMFVNGNWEMVCTPKAAAEKLNLKEGYVRQLCDMGKLIGTKINGRWWVHEQRYKDSYVDSLHF